MNWQPCSALNNQRGYMAVFIALIFQVLFIFFAMVINVGLLVHDKINLQNSVDLAAYYAAGKQAEVLDAIAHTNYQIRQSWKLLSWRIRALGDMAAKDNPLLLAPPSPDETNPQNPMYQDVPISEPYPLLCIIHSWWKVKNPDGTPYDLDSQNFCKRTIDESPVKYPDPPPPIAFFLPINEIIYGEIQRLKAEFNAGCETAGTINFIQAIKWMGAYKGDIANRTQVIELYKKSLSDSTADFPDLENGSVKVGAQKTLEKNLTRANQGAEMKFYNSFGHPAAKGQGTGAWLHKIPVVPQLYYMDPKIDDGCKVDIKPCYEPPRYQYISSAPNDAKICREPPTPDDPMQSTVGYEKNPWIMGYVGIEATVTKRRPFAPFGGTVELKARAFAKPFGGRIGPWFRTVWPKDSPMSASGDYVDKLLPFARPEGGSAESDTRDKNVLTPNYSRFPGDTIGLRSKLTLAQLRKAFLASPTQRIEPEFWALLPFGTFSDDSADVLAWEAEGNPPRPKPAGQYNGPWVRSFEVAAMVPDLFDITYYSIDPFFFQTYVQRASTNIFSQGVTPRPDLGYHKGSSTFEFMNIATQITQFSTRYDRSTGYIVRDPEQLLTGWAPAQHRAEGGEFSYEFPTEVFQKCTDPGGVKATRGIPGGCVSGGRVGYSVKIISENYLKDSKAVDGGAGEGPIMNPPPEEF